MVEIMTKAQVVNRVVTEFCSCGCIAKDNEMIDSHEDLRAQLADSQRDVLALAWALQSLRDVQNGPPLPKYVVDWDAAMVAGYEALERPGVVALLEKERDATD